MTIHGRHDDDSDRARSLRRRVQPDNEVPVSVPLDAVVVSKADLVVFVCGLAVYRNGLAFTLEARARTSAAAGGEEEDDVLGHVLHRHGRSAHQLLIGVEYADGRRCSTLDTGSPFEEGGPEDQPRLRPGGGHAGERSASVAYFLSPLPPSGELRIYCAWPSAGIDETVTIIDAGPILEAADRVRVLWPWEPARSRSRPAAQPTVPDRGWFAEQRRPRG
jgi:hypothetical protein